MSNNTSDMHHVQYAGASRRHYVMNRGGGRSDKPGVFTNFFNNVRQGLEKNKEMQVLEIKTHINHC